MKAMMAIAVALACCSAAGTSLVHAQTLRPASGEPTTAGEPALGKYTLYMFHKTNDASTAALAKEVTAFVQSAPDRAAFAPVDVNDPRHAAIVKQYDVARAPMPMVLAVAPNGAVTGAIPRKATAKDLEQLFVTPTMASCMKAMQSGRLAMVCVCPGNEVVASQGVQEFIAQPLYKDRVEIVPCRLNDKAEAEFLKELKISAVGESVLFAPPGVLVGTFGPAATYNDFAAAMKEAGKCCDDPNCKHAGAQVSAAPSSTQGRK